MVITRTLHWAGQDNVVGIVTSYVLDSSGLKASGREIFLPLQAGPKVNPDSRALLRR
jgi:hypothetical protein